MKIRAIALDFDGVLTDGTFAMSRSGIDDQFKVMSFRDRTGIAKANAANIPVAIISIAHPNAIAQEYAALFGCIFFNDATDKLTELMRFANLFNVDLSEIAYMGDDEVDIPVMKAVGLSGVPMDAFNAAYEAATFRSRYSGGRGAVRDFIETILDMYQ